ncbi:MAG TPA: hypothetical protein VJ044_02730, partial [Candidatus Hodarchaeales archaeon]|nr:hypothetical protein [Candidatus Hodarchaeales archaeon]
LRGLILAKRQEIRTYLENTRQMQVGSITDCEISSCSKYKGYGGTTFVVEAKLRTVQMGMMTGGMVIKFANDVHDEVENARKLHAILNTRQKEWDEIREKGFLLPDSMKHFPERIYAPGVLGIHEKDNILMLEVVDQVVSLSESIEVGGLREKLNIVGYSLARLHGFKEALRVDVSIYEPLLSHIRPHIPDQTSEFWRKTLGESYGAISFIHGDSHLQNLLRSGTNLAWIDAMLVPNSDRMDDVGYALSYLLQKEARDAVYSGRNYDVNTLLQYYSSALVKEWIPDCLFGYKAIVDLPPLYNNVMSIDFFLGAHLIVRSGLWQDQKMVYLLKELGKYFLVHAPILTGSHPP